MKKTLSIMLALAIFLTTCGFVPMNVNAAEEPHKITVYDGSGTYIGEFESFKEFEMEYLGNNHQQRGAVATWLLKISAVYGLVAMILDISYVFTGIEAETWLRENIVIPFYDSAKTMNLYSLSGGITNPYPPNSYQYSQFNKTNYYWIVE